VKLLIIIIAIAICCTQPIHAENKNSSRQLGLSISFGFHPGGESINFGHDYSNGTHNTTIAYGCGMSVGNIDFLFSSIIGFAVEVSSVPLNANAIRRSDGSTAIYDGIAVPILIWSEVSQYGKFGPFLRFGIGTIHLRLSKRYNLFPWYNTGVDFLSFAYGLSGGLRYLISENIECLFVVEESIGTDKADSFNEFGWTSKSTTPFGITFLGLKARYWF
jgi:hypothetical protein